MKKSKFFKVGTLLLAAVMMVSVFAGCGDDDGGDNGNGNGNGGTPSADGYVYVPEYIKLPEEVQDLYNACYLDGKLYFTGYAVVGKDTYTDYYTGEEVEYDVTEQGLFSINIDGTGLTELENYVKPAVPEGVPEGAEGDVYIQRLMLDPEGNVWVYENSNYYHYDLPEDFDETTGEQWQYYVEDGSFNYLRKLDPTGAELASVNLEEITEQSNNASGGDMMPGPRSFYMSGVEIDKDGNIYIADGNQSVYVLDAEGAIQFKVEVDNWINALVRMGDGRVGCTAYEEAGYALKPIDYSAKAWGQSVELPQSVWNVYTGDESYLVYCSDSSNFYGYNAETGESEKIFNYINCDIDSNYVNSTVALGDGRILCTSNNWRNNVNTSELIILSKKPASEVEQKKILTLACMYLDYNIRSEIINFNKTNGTYRIEVHDYSEYNTEDDYNAGLTKLTTEIISGQIPDILDTNSLPIKQYAAKGYLEDLWPYIDADPEVNRANLMENVFKVIENDGKLYQVGPRFAVFTAMGNSGIVGTEPGWTVDEMFAALEKLPEGAQMFDQYTTRDTILMYSLFLGMDEFVNWNTGECRFNSEEFVKILEFANSFPAEFDWDNYDYELDYESEYSRITSGKQMLVISDLSDFNYFQVYKQMLGGEITFKGFPTESRNGSALSIDSGALAMSSQCANKEGAWEFMRIFLTEDYQKNNVWWGLPTNKAAFDTKLEEAMTPNYYTDPETGEEVEQSKGGWGWGDDEMIEIYAMTQEEADMLTGLINGITRNMSTDQSMYDIIMEEVAAYFSGQKSAQDVASIVQSRVNIYVNEQR